MPDVCPTIDAHIACWHVLIGEFEMQEVKCNQVATLCGGKLEKTYEESRRVYGVDGIAPTVHTQGGGNQETKILVEPLAYDEQNGYLRRDGTVGTITTDGSSPKHNNRVVEPVGYEYAGVAVHPVSKKLEFDGYKDGACPTLLATDWNCPKTILEEKALPIVYDGFNGQVRTDSTTIGTITRHVGADLKRNGQGIVEPKQAELRVRKLTERECFRLQGVRDADFAKIRQNQSVSSCYHLAGDSITTSVLMALFGQMLGVDCRGKVDALVEDLQRE